MTTEIAAFVTSLGHATNIFKTLLQARDEAKRKEALAELREAFADLEVRHLAVIQQMHALLEQNEALKKQLAAYDKWEQESARYALEDVGAGALVRAFHPAQPSEGPAYWLCATCYESRQKSPLQRTDKVNHYVCPKCHATVLALRTYPPA